MITETMLLVAIRQQSWAEVESMTGKLEETGALNLIKYVSLAAELAVKDNLKARVLLSIWAELRWLEITKQWD